MTSTLVLALSPLALTIDTTASARDDGLGSGPVYAGPKVEVRKSDIVSRQRSHFVKDTIRFGNNPDCDAAYKAMIALLPPSDLELWCTSDKPGITFDTIRNMLDKRRSVPCPWPTENRTLHQHQPTSNHSLDLSFGFIKPPMYSELYTMSSVVEIEGKATRTIAFKADGDQLRKFISTDILSHERWDSKSSFHVLPVSIQTKCIRSSLKNRWQISLVSKLPTMRKAHKGIPSHTEVQMFPASLLIGPSTIVEDGFARSSGPSDQFVQQCPVYETGVDGDRRVNVLHQIRSAVYSSADFSRWINVDFVRLFTDLMALNDSNESKSTTTSLSVGQSVVAVPMPTNWGTLYNADVLSIQYIVLTEYNILRKIHIELCAALKLKAGSSATKDAPFGDVIQGDATKPMHMLVPYAVLHQHLTQRARVYDREQYMMRLDNMTLHLSPSNGEEGWTQLASYCKQLAAEHGGDVKKDEHRAQFSADLTFLYEPSMAAIIPDETFKSHSVNNSYPYSMMSSSSSSSSSSGQSGISSYFTS